MVVDVVEVPAALVEVPVAPGVDEQPASDSAAAATATTSPWRRRTARRRRSDTPGSYLVRRNGSRRDSVRPRSATLTGVTEPDWYAWHRPYEISGSSLTARLAFVQSYLAQALDAAPPGEISLISACAGQGLDVLGVLPTHPRRGDVRALLVELDGRNTAVARAATDAAGLEAVEIVTGDASTTDAYAAMAPADVVLLCGIFGNVTLGDIARTVELLPTLCAPRASVLWTRHRWPPDRTGEIRALFAEGGFEELAFASPRDHEFVGVGYHRFVGEPRPFAPGHRLFEFVGRGDAEPIDD